MTLYREVLILVGTLFFILVAVKILRSDGHARPRESLKPRPLKASRKGVAYAVLLVLFCGFIVREAGEVVGANYGFSLLPESLSFIRDLDRTLLFFCQPKTDLFSKFNYVVIVGSLLMVGLLRQVGRLEPYVETVPKGVEVHGNQNPFAVGVPSWKKEIESPK